MSVIKLHERVDGKTKFVVRNVLPHQMPVLAAINSKNHTHTHTHTRVHTYKVNTVTLTWRDCGKHQNCLSQDSWSLGSYSDPEPPN